MEEERGYSLLVGIFLGLVKMIIYIIYVAH